MPGGLSIQTMRNVVNANRSRFKKSFRDTQLRRAYTLAKWILANAQNEDMTHTIEWTLRRSGITGSTQFLDAFEAANFVRGDYDVSMRVQPITWTTHKNMVFDRIAMAANRKSPEKLWDDYKMKASAAEEARYEMLEEMFLKAPPTPEGGKDGFLGLQAWFARSMTSGGVYVPQPRALANGVYRRYTSTGVSAYVGNLNAADAANQRLRTMVGTHDGKVTERLLDALDDAARDIGIEYIPELQGETTQGPLTLLWSETLDRAYDRMLSKMGGPKGRDFYSDGPTRLRGVKVVGVHSFNNNALQPIFGIRPQLCHLIKFNGMWGVEGEQQLTHNSYGWLKDWTGQMRCEDPAVAGFYFHGPFTTGT